MQTTAKCLWLLLIFKPIFSSTKLRFAANYFCNICSCFLLQWRITFFKYRVCFVLSVQSS